MYTAHEQSKARNTKYRQYLYVVAGLALKGISVTSFFLAFILYRPPPTEVLKEVDVTPDTEEKTGTAETDKADTDEATNGVKNGRNNLPHNKHSLPATGAVNGSFEENDDVCTRF